MKQKTTIYGLTLPTVATNRTKSHKENKPVLHPPASIFHPLSRRLATPTCPTIAGRRGKQRDGGSSTTADQSSSLYPQPCIPQSEIEALLAEDDQKEKRSNRKGRINSGVAKAA